MLVDIRPYYEKHIAKDIVIMGLQDIILQKVLKIVDNTIGKKFKIVDDLTDLIQGSEGRLDKLEERITKLENKRSI